jgi:predicted nucleic acid-binding protein
VLIVDTGPLVATADRADKDHEACRQLCPVLRKSTHRSALTCMGLIE